MNVPWTELLAIAVVTATPPVDDDFVRTKQAPLTYFEVTLSTSHLQERPFENVIAIGTKSTILRTDDEARSGETELDTGWDLEEMHKGLLQHCASEGIDLAELLWSASFPFERDTLPPRTEYSASEIKELIDADAGDFNG